MVMRIMSCILRLVGGGSSPRSMWLQGPGLAKKMKFTLNFCKQIEICFNLNFPEDPIKFFKKCLNFCEGEIQSNVEAITKN